MLEKVASGSQHQHRKWWILLSGHMGKGTFIQLLIDTLPEGVVLFGYHQGTEDKNLIIKYGGFLKWVYPKWMISNGTSY